MLLIFYDVVRHELNLPLMINLGKEEINLTLRDEIYIKQMHMCNIYKKMS